MAKYSLDIDNLTQNGTQKYQRLHPFDEYTEGVNVISAKVNHITKNLLPSQREDVKFTGNANICLTFCCVELLLRHISMNTISRKKSSMSKYGNIPLSKKKVEAEIIICKTQREKKNTLHLHLFQFVGKCSHGKKKKFHEMMKATNSNKNARTEK